MAKRTDRPTVTETIREALIEGELSRYEVSKRSGVDQSALHRFVNGGGLHTDSLEKVALALGLEIVVRKKGRKKV